MDKRLRFESQGGGAGVGMDAAGGDALCAARCSAALPARAPLLSLPPPALPAGAECTTGEEQAAVVSLPAAAASLSSRLPPWPMVLTARQVSGRPLLSSSPGSSMPYRVAISRVGSAMMGKSIVTWVAGPPHQQGKGWH